MSKLEDAPTQMQELGEGMACDLSGVGLNDLTVRQTTSVLFMEKRKWLRMDNSGRT